MYFPPIPWPMTHIHSIFNAEETMHTDQTGCFPANSSSGNKYIMVLVEIDGNYIDGEPMKDRTEGPLIKAYQILWERITASKSVRPKTHVLDNEALEAFKKEIKKILQNTIGTSG